MQVMATFLTLTGSAHTDRDRRYMNWARTSGLRRWQIAAFCWGRVLRRRSAGGSIAHETSPPPAPGQTKVCYRDIALNAPAIGGGTGGCLLIEFGGAAIAKTPFGQR